MVCKKCPINRIEILDLPSLPAGATADDDFLHVSIFTLTSSQRRQCLNISIVHDAHFEDTESFSVLVYRTEGLPSYVILSPDRAIIRITHVHSE